MAAMRLCGILHEIREDIDKNCTRVVMRVDSAYSFGCYEAFWASQRRMGGHVWPRG